MRLKMVGPVVVALAMVSACGAVPAPAGGSTVALGQADAGKTAEAKVGDTVRVTLQDDFPVPGSSVVWNVTSPDTSVLQPGVVSRSSPQAQSGLGKQDTYIADFRAMAAGQSVLDAHGTTSCEAMTKQACPDRDFKITVVVSS